MIPCGAITRTWPDRKAIRFAPDPAPQGGRETPTLGAGHEPALGRNASGASS